MKLIENWKESYKMYSVWFFLIIGIFPDLYQTVINTNDLINSIPDPAVWTLRILAGVGIITRLIKQDKLNDLSNLEDLKEELKPVLEDPKSNVNKD